MLVDRGRNMQTITSYVYSNQVEIQVVDPTIFTTRNRVVYNRTIKVYQGIDNPLQIVIKNQDQKNVDMTGYDVQVDIRDTESGAVMASYSVGFSDVTRGLGTIVIDRETVNDLDQRYYKLTTKRISEDSESPNYIDDNYSVSLDLEVLPGY